MNRRIAVPLSLVGGLVLVGGLLEFTGSTTSRSPTGQAAGGASFLKGCAAEPVVDAAGEDESYEIAEGTVFEAPANTAGPTDQAVEVVEGSYVIRFRDDLVAVPNIIQDGRMVSGIADLDDGIGSINFTAVESAFRVQPAKAGIIGFDHTLVVETDASMAELLDAFGTHDAVEWIEPVTVFHTAGLPDDPSFSRQWNLSSIGTTEAWDTATGANVTVAVIDSGVSQGTDGYGKLLQGYDFVDDDTDAADFGGHGTHVAGTIAQTTNNALGVAGVAFDAAILPIRVVDPDGKADSDDVASAIIWAVDNGAQIINLSIASASTSQVVIEALEYAEQSDVLVIAAAGNSGFTEFISFPASYSTVMGVGATDLNGELASYSNRGSDLDLVAPGGDVTADLDGDGIKDGILQETTQNGEWGYLLRQGTSMAAAHVSGVAALVRSRGVDELFLLRAALTATAEDLGEPGPDATFGDGMVDANAAVTWTGPGGDEPKFSLMHADATAINPVRGSIRWGTPYPSTTEVRGGRMLTSPVIEYTLWHKVTVSGRPGETISYDLQSAREDGSTANTTVQITFPEVDGWQAPE